MQHRVAIPGATKIKHAVENTGAMNSALPEDMNYWMSEPGFKD